MILVLVTALPGCEAWKDWQEEKHREYCDDILENPSRVSWKEEFDCETERRNRDVDATDIICAKHGGRAWSKELCVRHTANGDEYSPVYHSNDQRWDNCLPWLANEYGEECGDGDVNCTQALPPFWCQDLD